MNRTLDATILNALANEPTVRPWLGGTQVLDLTSVVANPENFAFLTDEQKGGYIYHKLAQGLYMVHTLSVPEGRGRQMLEARTASLREMFTKSDAIEIATLVPDGNKGADVWAAHAGFHEVWRRPKAFNLMGEMVGVSYRSLPYVAWGIRDKASKYDGAQFHAQLHAIIPDDHGEDPVHDAMVGATMECCLQGNAEKGIALYNRWGAHAGYEQIRVVTVRPLVLDIRSCVIQYDADGLHVLHVREPAQSAPVEDADAGAAECQLPPLAQPQA